MAVRPWRLAALCPGYGGLELGLRLCGVELRPVVYVEREAFAVANLVAQMDAGAVARAPVWSDVCTFDPGPWRGRVDIVTAGFPCQPFSVAGSRRGVEDERWLWPDIARIVRGLRPSVVWLENVPGLAVHGLGHVLGSLAELGFDAEWGVFRASEAGAPHRRARIFVLAYSDRSGLAQQWRSGRHCAEDGPHAYGREPDGCEPGMGHAHGAGSQVDEGERGDARTERASVVGAGGGVGFPPGPDDADGWREYIAAGGPEPALHGSADGYPGRVDRVRMCGQGAVPQQVALAWTELVRRVLG